MRRCFYSLVLVDITAVVIGILVVSAAEVTVEIVVGISVRNLVLGNICDIVSAIGCVPVVSFILHDNVLIKGVLTDHGASASVADVIAVSVNVLSLLVNGNCVSASCFLPVILTVVGVGISGIVATELIRTNLTNTVTVYVGMVFLTDRIYVVSARGSKPVIVSVKGVYVRVGVVTELIVTVVTNTVVVLSVNVRCLGDCYGVSTCRSVPVSILVTGKGGCFRVVTELLLTYFTESVVVNFIGVSYLFNLKVLMITGDLVPVISSVKGCIIRVGMSAHYVSARIAKSVVVFKVCGIVYVTELFNCKVLMITGDSVVVTFSIGVSPLFCIGVGTHYVSARVAKSVVGFKVCGIVYVTELFNCKVLMITGDSVVVTFSIGVSPLFCIGVGAHYVSALVAKSVVGFKVCRIVYVRFSFGNKVSVCTGVFVPVLSFVKRSFCKGVSAHYVSARVAKTVELFKVFGIVYVGDNFRGKVAVITGDVVPVSVLVKACFFFKGVSAHYVSANVTKSVVGFKIVLVVYVSCKILSCFFTIGKIVVTNSLVVVSVLVRGPFFRELVVTVLISAVCAKTVVLGVGVSYLLVGKSTVDKSVTSGIVPVILTVVAVRIGVGVLVLVVTFGTLVICIPDVSCSFHGAVGSYVSALRGSGVSGFVVVPDGVIDLVLTGTYYVITNVTFAVLVFVNVRILCINNVVSAGCILVVNVSVTCPCFVVGVVTELISAVVTNAVVVCIRVLVRSSELNVTSAGCILPVLVRVA